MVQLVKKFYVRLYHKLDKGESWQTLGPYLYHDANKLVLNYLKIGICAWVQSVESE